MTSIFERFMRGLELRDDSKAAPQPIDFAVWDESRTLLLLLDWWTVDWGVGNAIEVVPGSLDSETLTFDGIAPSNVVLGTPSDGFFEGLFVKARERQDLDRASYLSNLLRLMEFEPDFDYTPWVSAMEARPRIDLRAVRAQEQERLRAAGVIRLLDSDGRTADALAIDEDGQTEVIDEGGWLALFADEWSGYSDRSRPEVGMYLIWLSTQRPYGAFSLSTPEVKTVKGPLLHLLERVQP